MNPRALELIHLELDNRLDAPGRLELDALLAADGDLRTHRDDLRAVGRALASAPAPELPAGFREAVLRRLQAPATPDRGTGPNRSSRVAAKRRIEGRHWRRGLALAASVIVAVVVLRVADQGVPAPQDQMAATLAPARPTVSAEPTSEGQRLSFRIPGGGPAQIVIEFASGGGRIVVPLEGPAQTTVQMTVKAGDFEATLVRGGAKTPIGQRPTIFGVDGNS